MRGKSKYKKPVFKVETRYNDPVISKLINKVMIGGKKTTAERIVYTALEKVAKEQKTTPSMALQMIIEKAAPILEVKSRRVGGATYQVPMEVKPSRKAILVFRWILNSTRSKQGKPMSDYLYEEMSNILNSTGEVMKKREELHKMAEANRAFAHFARY